jgi:hypothetical protein
LNSQFFGSKPVSYPEPEKIQARLKPGNIYTPHNGFSARNAFSSYKGPFHVHKFHLNRPGFTAIIKNKLVFGRIGEYPDQFIRIRQQLHRSDEIGGNILATKLISRGKIYGSGTGGNYQIGKRVCRIGYAVYPPGIPHSGLHIGDFQGIAYPDYLRCRRGRFKRYYAYLVGG